MFSGVCLFHSSYKIPVLMDIATSPSLQRPRTTQPHNMPCTKQRGAFFEYVFGYFVIFPLFTPLALLNSNSKKVRQIHHNLLIPTLHYTIECCRGGSIRRARRRMSSTRSSMVIHRQSAAAAAAAAAAALRYQFWK